MPKNPYESPNPRRIHTFMSAEDVSSGKKSSWYELEILGAVRNLCPELWNLEHLTSLYLNDNHLQRVPPEICRLTQLTYLDLSSNKLRSVPGEIGELMNLRELLLNKNYLRVLPYELGKLFRLQTLGLKGNPLDPQYLQLYNESNGTQKLLAFMLDSLQWMLEGLQPTACGGIIRCDTPVVVVNTDHVGIDYNVNWLIIAGLDIMEICRRSPSWKDVVGHHHGNHNASRSPSWKGVLVVPRPL